MSAEREAFRKLLGEFAALKMPDSDDPLQKEFEAAVVAAAGSKWDAMKPKERRRRPRPSEVLAARRFLTLEEHSEIFAVYKVKADEVWEERKAKRESLDKELTALAASLEPRPGSMPEKIMDASKSTYNSQGWSAESYARGLVEINRVTFAASYPALKFEINELRWGLNKEPYGWALMVHVEEELDAEIVRRRGSKTPIDELVRLCWKHGRNPRVYMPFLPHGFEERNGLDYFGNRRERTKSQ
jgi:hypothetical protein